MLGCPRNCACTKKLSIYWPPNHAVEGKNLLENKDKFCSAFFHIMPVWEFDIFKHTCLRDDEFDCVHKNVTAIVRVDHKDGTHIKTIRYTNCIQKNRRPQHTEEFIIKDRRLSIQNTKITMYIQLQPCHHSGGRNGTYDFRSCTDLIIKWYNEILIPRNIDLSIECGSLYKAMWTEDSKKFNKHSDNIYSDSSTYARNGIKILFDSGIKMSMITEDGWNFLLSHTGDEIIITDKQWEKRNDANEQFNNLLLSIKKS